MVFQKPRGVKYTDMCIYIDNIVARGDPTEEEQNKIFEYLYHLSFMLAHKRKYFNQSFYYEEFALYFATQIMHRLFFNPRLKELDENGEPVLSPIKSVLNFMKGIIYGRKVEFEQKYYSQKYADFEDGNYLYSFNKDPYESLKSTDIELYLKGIKKTVKHIVYEKNYYKNDRKLMKNIYLSTLLTVLSGLTFSNSDSYKLDNTYSSIDSKYRLLTRLYSKNRENSLVLYHLDDSFESYIKVLSNKVYKTIKTDLAEMSSQNYAISDAVMTNILFLEINGENFEDN